MMTVDPKAMNPNTAGVITTHAHVGMVATKHSPLAFSFSARSERVGSVHYEFTPHVKQQTGRKRHETAKIRECGETHV
jgi:hypothetical protein